MQPKLFILLTTLSSSLSGNGLLIMQEEPLGESRPQSLLVKLGKMLLPLKLLLMGLRILYHPDKLYSLTHQGFTRDYFFVMLSRKHQQQSYRLYSLTHQGFTRDYFFVMLSRKHQQQSYRLYSLTHQGFTRDYFFVMLSRKHHQQSYRLYSLTHQGLLLCDVIA
ncbi:hypothetical protein J6590_066789 [Homalodisca vitripennis]|nr:hypothetical protein J6590_066789 [Homalodisca vitripennis]